MRRLVASRLSRLESQMKPESSGILILRRYEDDSDEFFERHLKAKEREFPGGPELTIVIGNFGTRPPEEGGQPLSGHHTEVLQ